MYYIIRGDCVVMIQDHLTPKDLDNLKEQQKNQHLTIPSQESLKIKKKYSSARYKKDKNFKLELKGEDFDDVKLLCEGQMFGEIRCIYDCPRTASIISRTYNTLAELSYPDYREVISDYPEFQKYLKQHIASYDETDHKQHFLIKSLQKVPYFSNVSEECIHDILYEMVPFFYEKEETIIREGQNADKLVLIEYGQVEVLAEFEGNKFVIERLGAGAVFNHRTIFMNDYSHITYECSQNTSTLELDEGILNLVAQNQVNFSKDYRMFLNRHFRQNKTYPLDYIQPKGTIEGSQ